MDSPSLPEPSVCAGHRYLERKIDDLASDVHDGFERLGQKIEDVRVEQAETNSSLKGAWHRINELERQAGDVPIKIEKAVHTHMRGCPINDVTEVGIKSDRRRDGDRGRSESCEPTPKRRSLSPPSTLFPSLPRWAVAIGVGVVLACVLLGVFLSIFMSTGSVDKASHAVRGLAEQVGSHATIENETGESPQAATAATGGSYDDPDRN